MIKNLFINFKKRVVLPVAAFVVAVSSASAILPALSASALTTNTTVPVVSLDGWDLSDTSTDGSGHNTMLANGLEVKTDASGNRKAAGYVATNFALSDIGITTVADGLNVTNVSGGVPSLQLRVDFDNNGQADGYLVGEAVYGGTDFWLPNSAPWAGAFGGGTLTAPETGGGFGSNRHGSLAEWLALYPDARVTAIGYSLGSGVTGDDVIHSITAGGTTYQFGSTVDWGNLSLSPDRTMPSSVSVANNNLVVKVNQARTDVTVSGSASSVSGYKFYGVEGVKGSVPSAVNYVSADLYVDPSWSGHPVSAGLWGTTTADANVTPIIEYATSQINGTAVDGFRVFDTMDNAGVSTSLWHNLNYTVTPGQTYNLGIKDVDGQYHYYINGTEVAVLDAVDTTATPNVPYDHFNGVIFNSYNSHTGNTADNYNVKWSNFQAYNYVTLPGGSTVNTGTPVDNGNGSLVTTVADNVTTSGADTTVTIPAGTTVSAASGSNWNGEIAAPTAVTVTVPATSGFTTSVAAAISVGDATTSITFSQPVSVTLAGQAGKLAGFIDHSGTFHAITVACVGNTIPAGSQECVTTSGSDMVIWTTHFTTFVAYNSTPVSTTSNSTSTTKKSTSVATTTDNNSVATTNETPTGASTTDVSANTNNSDQSVKGADSKSSGFAWYWWLIIVIVLAAIGYGIYRGSAKNDKQ